MDLLSVLDLLQEAPPLGGIRRAREVSGSSSEMRACKS